MKKKVFITGGSSGIGEYLSEQLQSNCEVLVTSRSPSKIPETTYYLCDLRDENQISDLVHKISKENIDIFILNAGLGYFGKFSEISLEQEKEMFQVNFWANMVFIKKLLPLVSDTTKFIFVWSVAGKSLFLWWAGYQSSKFALRWFVWSLRKELGNRVFLINPKIVDTNFHKNNQNFANDYKKTALSDILEAVENIIDDKQDQWEIDL